MPGSCDRCEQARWTGDDIGLAENLILHEITQECAAHDFTSELRPPSPWPDALPGSQLRTALAAWAKSCPRPLVRLVDEIDSLSGRALISVLSQLRAGHNARVGGGAFPASVVLCGMRKIRDYKAASGGNPETRTAGPARHRTAHRRADLPPVDADYDDDVSYVQDLGLISAETDVQVANPIYREVIVRLLTAGTATTSTPGTWSSSTVARRR